MLHCVYIASVVYKRRRCIVTADAPFFLSFFFLSFSFLFTSSSSSYLFHFPLDLRAVLRGGNKRGLLETITRHTERSQFAM